MPWSMLATMTGFPATHGRRSPARTGSAATPAGTSRATAGMSPFACIVMCWGIHQAHLVMFVSRMATRSTAAGRTWISVHAASPCALRGPSDSTQRAYIARRRLPGGAPGHHQAFAPIRVGTNGRRCTRHGRPSEGKPRDSRPGRASPAPGAEQPSRHGKLARSFAAAGAVTVPRTQSAALNRPGAWVLRARKGYEGKSSAQYSQS